MYKVIKFIYGKELNNDNAKTYLTKEAAKNAGNSWMRDCTVHAEIRKGRCFEIVQVK